MAASGKPLDADQVAVMSEASTASTGKSAEVLAGIIKSKCKVSESHNPNKAQGGTDSSKAQDKTNSSNKSEAPNSEPPKRSNRKWLVAAAVAIALGGGGYYGFGEYQAAIQERENQANAQRSQQAAANDRETTIRHVQTQLIQLGYQVVQTGTLDTRTTRAIEAFEANEGMIVTGEVDEVLQEGLTKAITREDVDAWVTASNTNTQASYNAYLTQWPTGSYVERAKEALNTERNMATLTINTTPADARVRILNIGPAYSPGMQLAEGDYHIEVSKLGFYTVTRWVTLSERTSVFDFALDKISDSEQIADTEPENTLSSDSSGNSDAPARIALTTIPFDATVELLTHGANQPLKHFDTLPAGKYQILVSAEGYEPITLDAPLVAGETWVNSVTLTRENGDANRRTVSEEQLSQLLNQERFNTDVPLGIDSSVTAPDHRSNEKQASPIVTIHPKYPLKAVRDGLEGWVKLSFDVDETGAVENIQVMDAYPSRVFDAEAKKALTRWKYKPRIENGVAVRQTGLTVQLDFTLEDS